MERLLSLQLAEVSLLASTVRPNLSIHCQAEMRIFLRLHFLLLVLELRLHFVHLFTVFCSRTAVEFKLGLKPPTAPTLKPCQRF